MEIINGLSELSHPCQIISDILTFEEIKGNISGKTLAWLGDGTNNMAYSLIEASAKLDFILNIGCPTKYSPGKKTNKLTKNKFQSDNPFAALKQLNIK